MLPPNFESDVLKIVEQIPKGRVTSYGAIASCLGVARSSRMVGWVLGKSKARNVPAHRVVNRNGLLTGKAAFGNDDEMQKLLEAEGVVVKDNEVQAFEDLFWNPVELGRM